MQLLHEDFSEHFPLSSFWENSTLRNIPGKTGNAWRGFPGSACTPQNLRSDRPAEHRSEGAKGAESAESAEGADWKMQKDIHND